jgi:hypothetical protein
MNKRKCGHLAPCGCEDVALTTPAPCPDPGPCPTPYPCSETTDAQCVLYTGEDILCDDTTIVAQDMNVAEAMAAIVEYFCNATGSIAQNIECGDDVVVTAGSTFADAFEQVVAYFCANTGLTIVQGDNQSINVSLVGNTYTVSQLDTGWVNLNGFDYYQGVMATQKPQVRRIGKQIHFRGNLYIPLGDDVTITPLTTPDTYRTVMMKTPYADAGGVVYDADNRMYFNSNGTIAQSVIPTSVLGAGTLLDGDYKLTREMASRQLRVYDISDPDVQLEGTALLHAPIEVSILANKQLRITALETLEQNAADQTDFIGSSSLRQVTSKFTYRSFMINFNTYNYAQDGLNSYTGAPGVGGGLTIGRLYVIQQYELGDDFTNVGAVSNSAGQSFIATGVLPTNWTNGSRIVTLPQQIMSNDVFYPNLYPGIANASQWPILEAGTNLNGASPFDIGGFVISLDGLVGFIS